MEPTANILYGILFILTGLYVVIALLSLYHIRRYRNMVTDTDEERIACSPFQPTVSLVVNCDLSVPELIPRIRQLLVVHYLAFDVILVCDSRRNGMQFDAVLRYFELRRNLIPLPFANLSEPPRAIYRTVHELYYRLTVVDKPFQNVQDALYTGILVSNREYVLPVDNIENELKRNILHRMAVMVMRDADHRVITVRGAASYFRPCSAGESLFLRMSELSNLRRLYLGGYLKGNGLPRQARMKKRKPAAGKDEFVPGILTVLHRPNNLLTYLRQLVPPASPLGVKGKLLGMAELLLALFLPASLLLAVVHGAQSAFWLRIAFSAWLLILLCSTYSVFTAEILLKNRFRWSSVLWLLLISLGEALAFGILLPFAWLVRLFPMKKEG